MTKRLRGVLTIEAAIVLPLIMIAMVSIMFFAKVYYIQDQVHSAMTKAAHDLSVDVYALDRLRFDDGEGQQVSLIDMQQTLYLEGAESMGSLEETVSDIADNAGQLVVSGEELVSFGYDLNALYGDVQEISPGDVSSLLEAGQAALALLEEGENIAGDVGNSLTGMVDCIKLLYEEGMNAIGDVTLMEAVDFSNGLIADKMAESVFYGYLSEEELEDWGVYSGVDPIDFSMSSMMLYDDTVELAASYEIEIPLGHEWLGSSLPVFQKVRARVWTGSYDSDEVKKRPEMTADETADQIFYISDIDPDPHYHYYTCLRKVTVTSTYKVEVIEKGREVCDYCASHYGVFDGMPVYSTSSRAKIHLDEHCPKIYSSEISPITLEEAEAKGIDPCSKYGCVADPRKEAE